MFKYSKLKIYLYKLIFLVESKQEIYNITVKLHHKIDLINEIWNDISKEMNIPGIK